MKTLCERISKIDPEQVVTLKNEYGVMWIGKAKFVFGAVTLEAWTGNTVDVVINGAKVGE